MVTAVTNSAPEPHWAFDLDQFEDGCAARGSHADRACRMPDHAHKKSARLWHRALPNPSASPPIRRRTGAGRADYAAFSFEERFSSTMVAAAVLEIGM